MESSIASTSIKLISTLCAAGLLTVPYSFKPTGLIAGIILTSIVGLLSLLGLVLQVQVIRYVPIRYASFFSLSQIANPKLGILFDFAIALRSFCSCVIYLIVIGDLVPGTNNFLSGDKPLLARNIQLTLITFMIIAPLCFIKRAKILSDVKKTTIPLILTFCILEIFYLVSPSSEVVDLKGEVSIGLPELDHNVFISLSILLFVFNCHQNMFTIINEQGTIVLRDVKYIAVLTNLLQCLITNLVGIVGYLTFGDQVAGNILKSYPNTVVIELFKFIFIISMILSFLVQCHRQRAAIDRIYHWCTVCYLDNNGTNRNNSRISDASTRDIITAETTPLLVCDGYRIPIEELIEEGSAKQPECIPLSDNRFRIITFGVVICSFIIALFTTSLVDVVAFAGATASVMISFILPGLYAYYLLGSEYSSISNRMPFTTAFLKYAGLLLAICGILIMMIFPFFIFYTN